MTDKTIIYILGSSHTGSTLLNLLLGIQENIVSVGETKFLKDFILERELPGENNYSCSCGRKFKNCDFWKDIVCDIDSYALYDRQKNIRSAWKTPKELEKVYDKVFKKTNNDYIVENSKNLTYHKHVSKTKYDIKTIYMTRHIYGVSASHNKRGTNIAYAMIRWYLENKMFQKYLNNKPYMQVSHNRLTHYPREELNRLSDYLGTDLVTDDITDRVNNSVFHNFAGNQSLLNKEFEGINPSNCVQRLNEECSGGFKQLFYEWLGEKLVKVIR